MDIEIYERPYPSDPDRAECAARYGIKIDGKHVASIRIENDGTITASRFRFSYHPINGYAEDAEATRKAEREAMWKQFVEIAGLRDDVKEEDVKSRPLIGPRGWEQRVEDFRAEHPELLKG